MMQREMEKAIAVSEPMPFFQEKPTKPVKQLPPQPEVISSSKSTKIVKPVEPYKFDAQTREQLTEFYVWTSKGLDMAVDYGLGVDTSELPIWELSEADAEVFVRILERRAARNDYVRDVIVPKLLASRDYIEATILLGPRFAATVQGVVENGGIHPHIKRSDSTQ